MEIARFDAKLGQSGVHAPRRRRGDLRSRRRNARTEPSRRACRGFFETAHRLNLTFPLERGVRRGGGDAEAVPRGYDIRTLLRVHIEIRFDKSKLPSRPVTEAGEAPHRSDYYAGLDGREILVPLRSACVRLERASCINIALMRHAQSASGRQELRRTRRANSCTSRLPTAIAMGLRA